MKILVAGLGGIGQRHVRNLRTLLGSDVEIIAYRVRRHSHVFTETFEIEPEIDVEKKYDIKTYVDLDQALEQKPDAVFVCNPSSLHLSTALPSARAGCNLLIEKPLSANMEGVEELIDLVERKKLTALTGFQMRFHPGILRLRDLLAQRAIGSLLAINAEIGELVRRWHPYEDYTELYASRSSLGGGVILSQIHELDYLYWLLGLPRRIFALGGHLSDLNVDVEDTASILMEFNFDGSLVPVHLHQDYLQWPPTRTCHIIGDAGKILVDFNALSLQVFDGHGQIVEKQTFEGFQRNQLFLNELKHFLACVEGKEDPIVNLRDGAQSLRMALAAKESLTTGKVVELK